MLKIGDKVKMTPRGFKFYSNVDIQFCMSSVKSVMNSKDFEKAVCELFAIHGVGVVKKLNKDGDPFIIWNFNINGTKYHYSHYFEKKDIKKLTILDKVRMLLKGLL